MLAVVVAATTALVKPEEAMAAATDLEALQPRILDLAAAAEARIRELPAEMGQAESLLFDIPAHSGGRVAL